VPTDLQLDHNTLEIVAVSAAAAAVLCLLLTLTVLARLRVLGKRVRRLSAAGARGAAPVGGVDPRALRHVGVVRYDAFGDMGGRLSFSAALYDDNGDGLVISSINGRSETRTYAKQLVGHGSDHSLSPEEKEAIAAARRD
jgi:hypothetical protein